MTRDRDRPKKPWKEVAAELDRLATGLVPPDQLAEAVQRARTALGDCRLDHGRLLASLDEKSVALKQLLQLVTEHRKAVEEDVLINAELLVRPWLQRLRSLRNPRIPSYVEIIESNLKLLTGGFGRRLSEQFLGLSRREIEVCNMVRVGMTSKEIGGALGISPRSVEVHRYNIRRKLGISGSAVNLNTYLKSL